MSYAALFDPGLSGFIGILPDSTAGLLRFKCVLTLIVILMMASALKPVYVGRGCHKNLILMLINCMWICNSKYVGPQDFCTGPWFLLLPGRSCCAAPGKLKVQKNRVYMKSCKP